MGVVCGTRAAQLRIQTSPRTSRPEKTRSAPSWRNPPRIRTQTQCRQKKIGKKSLASRQLPPVLEVGGMPSASRTVLALSALDIPESGAAGKRLDMCGAGALRMPAPAVGTAAAMEEVCTPKLTVPLNQCQPRRYSQTPLPTSRPATTKWAPSQRSPAHTRTQTLCQPKQIGITRRPSGQQPSILGGGHFARRTRLVLSATDTRE